MGYAFLMTKSRPPKNLQKTVSPRRQRYKNEVFLKALGEHCRKLRLQRGYSIDRLSKESHQLSPASIDRLEKGLADSQILVLVRYAEVLNIGVGDLFAFLKDAPLLKDARIIPYEEGLDPSIGYVAVYPLTVAAGSFADGKEVDSIEPIGWMDANIKGPTSNYFAAFVHGQSMEPRIPDGSLCLFRRYNGGTRQGRVFLLQARGLVNNETGESFVVKKYMRQTEARTSEEETSVIHLISENPRFPPIVLVGISDHEIHTIAEFIRVL